MLNNKQLRRVRRKSKGKKTWCFVYLLKHPITLETKYVGQTRGLPKTRLKWHYKALWTKLGTGGKLSPVMNWLKEIQEQQMQPIIELLEDKGTWDITEAVWIDRLTNQGVKLLNVASRVR